MVEKKAGALPFNADKNGVLRKRKSRSESDDDDDLSDINDAEITGYLNNNTEILFKKLVWQVMNKDRSKLKQRNPATRKKSISVKGKEEEKEKEKEEENTKRRSSKINYDALEKLGAEPEEGAEEA